MIVGIVQFDIVNSRGMKEVKKEEKIENKNYAKICFEVYRIH